MTSKEMVGVVSEVSITAVLDLYVLKKKTDFYDQIMVAWNDAKIVCEGVCLCVCVLCVCVFVCVYCVFVCVYCVFICVCCVFVFVGGGGAGSICTVNPINNLAMVSVQ